MSMDVLLLGSGGREHAMAWQIAKSPLLGKLYTAPGNAGTAALGENIEDVAATDIEGVVALAKRLNVELVIVGPEDPLAAGIVDRLAVEGIRAFGPSAAAAEIESSKAFAKSIMAGAGIPTAAFQTFSNPAAAKDYARSFARPPVIKADGLTAGKGVTVCDTIEEVDMAIDATMTGRAFGDAGASVLVEERTSGPETSAHAFTDGVTVVHMPFSCDHKRVFDDDGGPNTGGMGAYSAPGWLSSDDQTFIQQQVTERAVKAMFEAGRPYRGVLYPGMMITPTGPSVIEFNCRFGDPETEVVLPKLKSDLLEICDAVASNRLADVNVEWSDDATVGVMMASGGYPGSYETGLPISGVDDVDEGVQVWMAGAQMRDGQLVTSGGRVLCVVASGATIDEARERVYDNVRRISFEGAHYRTDIAAHATEAVTT
ncbi:MAG TPA: phosphoribosylamine--glycine ligase [Dehalococcoidia bacterium]|nr:phosphoribosylamine--glycine ligase [Dehalococcoidia bacterium]